MTRPLFVLPPLGVVRPNNDRDPLPYYYKRSTGWLYRHRLQMGLDLLPAGGTAILEVGVGSGILIPTLTRYYRHYTGTDLDLAPNLDRLAHAGCTTQFHSADLLDERSLPEAHFDAIVCFSVLEHIHDSDRAAVALARALAPGGTLVTGYPMVNHLITHLFRWIGYANIEQDHVAPPAQISAALAKVLRPVKRAAFPPLAPVDAALYQCTSWTR